MGTVWAAARIISTWLMVLGGVAMIVGVPSSAPVIVQIGSWVLAAGLVVFGIASIGMVSASAPVVAHIVSEEEPEIVKMRGNPEMFTNPLVRHFWRTINGELGTMMQGRLPFEVYGEPAYLVRQVSLMELVELAKENPDITLDEFIAVRKSVLAQMILDEQIVNEWSKVLQYAAQLSKEGVVAG